MATQSRTSFQKRQKELLRAEKQREKAAKRQARRLAAKEGHNLDPGAEQFSDESGLGGEREAPEQQ